MLSGRLSEHDPWEQASPRIGLVRAREEDSICGARPGASRRQSARLAA